jgi:3-ketosteroid 9alpha-monooxygenase subunit A
MADDLAATAEFTYPRGWFMVARADELAADQPLELKFFGRKFAAFRDGDGRPVILDAICPHLGANIAVGGVVDGEGIRCPFHHWRFGVDGRCNDIPYSKIIPPRARIRSYPAREINGSVFLWHDPEYGAPDYELPDMAEYRDPQWVKWSMVRKDIRTVPKEIVDNIADRAHFPVVHGAHIAEFRNTFEGHKATQYAMNLHETLAATPGGGLPSYATYHGPAYLLTFLDGPYPSWMLICHTPIDTQHVAVWYGTMVKCEGEMTPEFRAVAANYVELGKVAFYQDVTIWENKEPAPQPLLCAGDGPILQARAWYAQFFRPRGEAAQHAMEPGETAVRDIAAE